MAHVRFGYRCGKTEFIPNGIDTEQFKPDEQARRAFRLELNAANGDLLVGSAGRYHPQKDHDNFVRAAAIIARVYPNVLFVLCGRDITWQNAALAASIRAVGLQQRVRLLGPRADMAKVFSGIDIAVSSSSTEAFPLAVGEAMAAGTPCAVTGVGDSAALVGKTGCIVPARDPVALAHGVEQLIEAGCERRRYLGDSARARVMKLFSLPATVEKYQDLYSRVATN